MRLPSPLPFGEEGWGEGCFRVSRQKTPHPPLSPAGERGVAGYRSPIREGASMFLFFLLCAAAPAAPPPALLTGHGDNVYAVAFAPDGRTLASASGDGDARIWDLATGKTLHTLTGHNG